MQTPLQTDVKVNKIFSYTYKTRRGNHRHNGYGQSDKDKGRTVRNKTQVRHIR